MFDGWYLDFGGVSLGLEITIRGTVPDDCPFNLNDRKNLSKEMERVVRERLRLRPEDKVRIIFKNKLKQNILKEFRYKVSLARESCAGSNVREISDVIRLVKEALIFYTKFKLFNIPAKLASILDRLYNVRSYDDRIEIDCDLCKILNEIDKCLKENDQIGTGR